MGASGSHRLGQDPEGIQVFIKTNKGRTLPLVLNPKWQIKDVKAELSTKLLESVHNIKIIFAGKELGDSVKLSDCDIGMESVLHAIQVQTINGSEPKDTPHAADQPLNESMADLQLQDEGPPSSQPPVHHRAHFWVYCNQPCQAMKPGKLRVRCQRCREGALIVERDPCNWKDVLEPQRVRGLCQNSPCAQQQDTFAEFFFKCSSHPASEDTPPLSMVRSNLNEAACLACLEVMDPVIVFECQDRHVICIDCFIAYGNSKLNERQFVLDHEYGYSLPCPAHCQDSLIQETRHFRLLGDRQYERYQRFGAEECVLQSGGVLCPQPDCGMGIMQDEPCRKITCVQGCGYVFCRDCLQGFHIGECHSNDQGEAAPGAEGDAGQRGISRSFSVNPDLGRWAPLDATSTAIRLTTKPCPQCRTATERDGGCMHMVCTKPACGFHWCWICQVEWTRECMANHWFG